MEAKEKRRKTERKRVLRAIEWVRIWTSEASSAIRTLTYMAFHRETERERGAEADDVFDTLFALSGVTWQFGDVEQLHWLCPSKPSNAQHKITGLPLT